MIFVGYVECTSTAVTVKDAPNAVLLSNSSCILTLWLHSCKLDVNFWHRKTGSGLSHTWLNIIILPLLVLVPSWVMASFLRFLDQTWCTTVGRTPLDEWSAPCRDLYLRTHNTYNRQTSMPLVGFKPTISVDERPQTYALDRGATGTGEYDYLFLGNVYEHLSF
jgi:hypothetical protein